MAENRKHLQKLERNIKKTPKENYRKKKKLRRKKIREDCRKNWIKKSKKYR